MEMIVSSGRRERIRRLWKVANDAEIHQDFARCARILRIAERFEVDPEWSNLIADYLKMIEEAQDTRGWEEATIRMSPAQLDKIQGADLDPAEIAENRESVARTARSDQKAVKAAIAAGKLAAAFESVVDMHENCARTSLTEEAPLPEERWASRMWAVLERRTRRGE